ncbi:MAG TPA: UvrD-helicase domain-containing protein, partial [Clostridia bacterium]|nr:UvrD-helicase domain-containing protein [Clostridia bacterium]
MTSKIKWTSEQLDAINTKGGNLLVAAAAGAGKTAVLVERIIQRVMDPVDPVDIDRLLVVTFTNAAATEMKERIGDALASALEQDDDSQILQRQLALLNRSSITTIHSFCLEVIRNNFHQLDIDPNFRIANQTEGVLLKLEALEELFEDRYLEEYVDAEFLNLVECYSSNRDDKRLQDMVLNLYNFVQSHPWPEKWLDEHSQDFNISKGRDFGTTTWGKELMGNLKIEIAGLGESMKRAIDIIEGAQGLEAYLDNFREEYSTIQDIVQSCNKGWESVHNSISGMEFRRLARCGKDADKNQQDQVRKIRDDAKASIRKFQQDLFSLDGDQIIKDLNELYPLMRCLTDLVLELDRRYKDKKRDKNLVDFNDLEHMCLEVLLGGEGEEGKPSKAALELRERFAEVLVDEYQDSNLVQEVILSTVSRKDSQNPNMFMVGDVKQSIYRFRQARPELFMDKYRSYSLDPGSKNRKIQLFKNFRSRKTVIDGVNFIFQQIMSKNVGELDYDDEEALRLGAIFKDNEEDKAPGGHPIEFCIVDMKDDSPVEEQFYEDSLDIIQTEGRIVAR